MVFYNNIILLRLKLVLEENVDDAKRVEVFRLYSEGASRRN